MTTDQAHPLPEVARVFVVANTPAYLFKHFRSIQSIQVLAAEMSTKAVVNRCRKLASLKKRTMDDELNFYVHLVALCFAPKSEYRGALADLAKSSFRWAKPLGRVPQVSGPPSSPNRGCRQRSNNANSDLC